MQQFVEDLNQLYLAEPGLWKRTTTRTASVGLIASDHLNSVISFLRQDAEHFSELVVIAESDARAACCSTAIGLPRPGKWREVLNSDAAVYGGSNMGNCGGVTAEDEAVAQPCPARPSSPCRR